MNRCLPLKRLVLTALLAVLWNLAGSTPGMAKALLKPTGGGDTQNLRARELQIEADIHGAFSHTTVTTIYANPNTNRIEADFIYTAPQNAVVTGFAYWFKGEKVIARVVEKERATEIYDLITRTQRDPAIVEMIGKNTFRARIFPVEAGADLQIEVQFIQPLSATPKGWQWSFPLAQESKEDALEKVRLEAKVAPDVAPTANFGTFANGALQTEKTKVQNAADIRIEIPAPRAPLRAAVFAARDGGSDGFFALALVPDFSAAHPRFAVSGLKTYDVMSDEVARAGHTFVAVGRYRGSGEALVKLGARSSRVNFPDRKSPGNIAALLWGARRIETLSKSARNRAATVHLSKRFNMPSKWTSWLAIPASEKKDFESRLVELEMNRAVRNWAQAVAAGDRNKEKIFRARAYQYDARLAKLTQSQSSLSTQTFRDALGEELDRVRQAKANKTAGKAQLARYERNLRRRGAQSRIEEDARRERARQARYERERKALALAEAKNGQRLSALERGDTARAKRLNAEISAIFKRAHIEYDPREEWTAQRLQQLATAIWQERKAGVEDSPRQQQLLRKVRALLPATKQNEQQILSGARSTVYAPDLQAAYQQLSTEIEAEREDGTRARQLQKRIAQLQPLVSPHDTGQDWRVGYSYRELASKLAADYARQADAGASPEELKPLKERARRNFERIDRDSKGDFDSFFARGWNSVVSDAVNTIANEIAAGRDNSPALQQAQARRERASKMGGEESYYEQYQINTAWKGRAHETAYLLLQARQKGDQATAAALEKRLQMEAEKAGEVSLDAYLDWEKNRLQQGEPLITAAEYRLRPGDPLISVRAPADCKNVVAILPSGELLPLAFDAQKGAWEARFDVPAYATEGEYKVVIVLVGAEGARKTLTMLFHVDTTAPDGKGEVHFQNDSFALRLESDENTDRVSAFLPWSERVELRRDESGVFGATAPVPAAWRNRAARVRFAITDKAHNRTELEVDWAVNKR